MSARTKLKIYEFIKFLLFLWISGTLTIIVSSTSASTSTQSENDHASHREMESQQNRPFLKHLDKLKNFSDTFKTCTSFFRKDEFTKHFQECVEHQSGGEKEHFDSSSEEAHETEEISDGKTKRHRRDALLQQRQPGHHGHWKMFENPHVYKNPCLISCVFMKFGMINSTGQANLENIQDRIQQILKAVNQTDYVSRSSNITLTCHAERNKQEEMLIQTPSSLSSGNQEMSADDMVRAKCRFVIQFGKCLGKNVFMACHDSKDILEQKGNSTAVHH